MANWPVGDMEELLTPTTQLVSLVADFAQCIFQHAFSENFYFHNLQHTQEVVKISAQIGYQNHLGRDDMELLLSSAWLHDLGYAKEYLNPEKKSIEIAKVFFHDIRLEKDAAKTIISTIDSTKGTDEPKSVLGKILADATGFHLASPAFSTYSERLKMEMECCTHQRFTVKEWIGWNIGSLEDYQYFTKYGKEVLEPLKMENLQRQKVCYRVYDNLISGLPGWIKTMW